MRPRTQKSSLEPLFKSLAIIAAVAAFTACSDNTGLGGTQAAGGVYALATVNGVDVPYAYNVGANTVTIQSDTYTLNSDGSYNETIDETISNGVTLSPATDTESGSWAQNGSAVVFAPSASTQGNFSQYTGSLSSGTTFSHSSLTFSNNGVVWVYNHT